MSEVRQYKYLSDLANCDFFIGFIKVRILHKHAYPGSSVDMVLIDQKGTTIHAKIQAQNVKRFDGDLEEGRVYDLSRFSIKLAERASRPTRHRKILWINPTTSTELIPEIKNFPTQRRLVLTPLETAARLLERKDTTYLHDLMGVVIGWTDPVRYDINKLKREVTIQDQTGTSIKITLWNEFADEFGNLNVTEKSVFTITSASMNVFQGVAQGFTNSRFSKISVDINHPKTIELKKSDKYDTVKAGIKLDDWRENEKTLLADIFRHFTPSKIEERYTSVGKIAHEETILYRVCNECNTKSPEDKITFRCTKCEMQVSTHEYCRSRIKFTDSRSTESLTLFGNQLESILKMKIGKIIDAYKNNTLSNAFAKIKDDSFVVLLKPNIGGSTMYLSISKIGKYIEPEDETIEDYIDTDDSFDNENESSIVAEDTLGEDSITDGTNNENEVTKTKSKALKRSSLAENPRGTITIEVASENSAEHAPETPQKTATKRKISQSVQGGRKNAKTRQLAANRVSLELNSNEDDDTSFEAELDLDTTEE